MPSALPILAQDEASASDFFKPILLLLIVVFVLIVAVQLVRKWIARGDAGTAPAAGFSLASLRDLVRQGKMTQEEYDKAKAQIVQATQRAAERAQPVKTIPPDLKSPREPGE